MTDLKGGLLSKLLTKKETSSFFSFLERGNWLIFQDAFPQFLLYEESLKRGKSLFFMEALWEYYWRNQDSYVLTIALIINEQSYLERRVIDNPIFKKKVFETLEFKLQDLLSLNHILIPYEEDGRVKLVGQTLKHFESLHERILLGKRLYTILFENKERLKQIEKWARKKLHSGSRKDYWPHIFNDIDEEIPGTILKPRLNSCQLTYGAPRFYSPRLQFAWKNIAHEDSELGDWYKSWQVINYFIKSKKKVDGEIVNEYCKTLERIELAATAKQALFSLD